MGYIKDIKSVGFVFATQSLIFFNPLSLKLKSFFICKKQGHLIDDFSHECYICYTELDD
jgi:hypothetical protein